MPMPSARDVMNEMERSYCIYKCDNVVFSLPSILFGGILCYGIYNVCISGNVYDHIHTLLACITLLLIIIVATYKFYKLRKSKCKDRIYNIAIDYFKTVYVYIAYAEIKKISFFDIMDILLVYRKCLELKILDEDLLENVNYIIEDLKSKSDL